MPPARLPRDRQPRIQQRAPAPAPSGRPDGASAPGAGLIERGIASRAFPAAVIDVGRGDGVLWRRAFGTLTYGAESPAATGDTVFDLASLTKVIATATLVMQAIEAGRLGLETRVAGLLPAWRGSDREAVTIADLLEHASGLTAYLPFFRDHRARQLARICRCARRAAHERSSDLGFMLLAFSSGRESAVREAVRRFHTGERSTAINPPKCANVRRRAGSLAGAVAPGRVHGEAHGRSAARPGTQDSSARPPASARSRGWSAGALAKRRKSVLSKGRPCRSSRSGWNAMLATRRAARACLRARSRRIPASCGSFRAGISVVLLPIVHPAHDNQINQ